MKRLLFRKCLTQTGKKRAPVTKHDVYDYLKCTVSFVVFTATSDKCQASVVNPTNDTAHLNCQC